MANMYKRDMQRYYSALSERKKRMWVLIGVTTILLALSICLTAAFTAWYFISDAFLNDDSNSGDFVFTSVGDWFEGLFDGNKEDSGEDGNSGSSDKNAPKVTPVEKNTVISIGSTVSYKNLIRVDQDDCTIKVDASGVNQNKEGTYTVKYTVTNSDGAVTHYDLKIVIKDGVYTWTMLESLIEEKAKSELGYTKAEAKNKTKVQIVRDIYEYVNDPSAASADVANIYFNDISNAPSQKKQGGQKTRTGWQDDWIEEAYLTLSMTRMKGDCYSYYSVSKAFFEYFGIENEGIERSTSSRIKGTHYWNIVKVEDGWYYYDATRLGGSFADGTRNACLITEAKLNGYRAGASVEEAYKGDFYIVDKWSGFPKISTKTLS